MDLKLFARLYGLPLEVHPFFQGFIVLLITVSILPKSTGQKALILFFSYSVSIICGVLKQLATTHRPCVNEPNNQLYDKLYVSCPKSSDVPSGHSAVGIFMGLALWDTSPLLASYYLSSGITRYIGQVHSLDAIAAGTGIGLIGFILYKIIKEKV